MSTKKINKPAEVVKTEAKIASTDIVSITEMNDVLIKAAKIVNCFKAFLEQDTKTLSIEAGNKFFDMFNDATYQDVMLFNHILSYIYAMLNDMPDHNIDVLSDGLCYFDLIFDKMYK